MMQFEKKIKVRSTYDGVPIKSTAWARGFQLGSVLYDIYGQRWEVMQDIHFDKYWFREVVTEK